MSMQALWTRFEAWLDEHWPEGRSALLPGASEHQLDMLQTALGVELPDDYLDCLRVHNGAGQFVGIFDNCEFLSTDGVLFQWQAWDELRASGTFETFVSDPAPGIKKDWWTARWIPFTHDGGGNHLCLDLDTAAGGTRGQVITMWHDDAERTDKAANFGDWFKAWVEGVESGEYLFADEYGGIVHKDDV